MNQNINLLSTPSPQFPQRMTLLQMQSQMTPNQSRSSLLNYHLSNMNNHPMKNIHDPFQYPYANNYPLASMTDQNQFRLQYNRSEKAFAHPPEADLELKRQISDSFLYLHSPLMNTEYIPLTSVASNSNDHPIKLLKKKRLREDKANNSPQSTDIDNTGNQGALSLNKEREPVDVKDDNILSLEPIASTITPKPKNKKKKKDSLSLLSKQEVIPSLDSSLPQSPNKLKSLPKGIVNRKRSSIQKEIDLYNEEEFSNDLDMILKSSSKHQFMYENFPNAYSKIEVLNHIKKLNEKRKLRKIFIEPSSLREKDIIISNPTKYECHSIKVPKKLWSPKETMKDNDYSSFYYKLEQKWPFDKCPCSIEHILEFLMINDYSQEHCLTELTKCVQFVRERISNVIEENDKDTQRYQPKKLYNLRERRSSK